METTSFSSNEDIPFPLSPLGVCFRELDSPMDASKRDPPLV